MNSRVDESDADTPQDEPLAGSGAPAARTPSPLDALFGRVVEQETAPASAASESDVREQLARLFARGPAPVAASEPKQVADAAGLAAAFSRPTSTVAAVAEPAVDEPEVPIVEDAALEDDADVEAAMEMAVDEPDVEQPEAWATIDDAETDAAVEELTGDAAFVELGLDKLVEDEPAADELAEDELAEDELAEDELDELAENEPAAEELPEDEPAADEPAPDEASADEPDFEEPALAATAVATAVVAETPIDPQPLRADEPPVEEAPASTEPRALGWAFDSPVPAEPQPYPHNGTFAPARPRRGVRGTLFGSRWRTAISVAVSIVLVLGLVAGAAVIAQNLAASARLAEAQSALEIAEGEVLGPTASLESASIQYDELVLAARASADGTTPALAAVTGMADAAALDAANVALAELIVALDEPAPPPPPAPYERGDVDTTDVDDLAAAASDARDYAEGVTAAKIRLDTAQAELALRLGALTETRNALGISLPATAQAIAGENAKAEQSFRDAVVAAAAAVGTAQAAGGSGDAELLAYAAAVTALRADQTRALAEEQAQPPTRPRTTPTNPGTTPTPTPTPTPTTPPPAPEPEPEPEPEPTTEPTPP